SPASPCRGKRMLAPPYSTGNHSRSETLAPRGMKVPPCPSTSSGRTAFDSLVVTLSKHGEVFSFFIDLLSATVTPQVEVEGGEGLCVLDLAGVDLLERLFNRQRHDLDLFVLIEIDA